MLCPYCKVIKPERAVHCHICNKCVDRYEGHCTWINNCVGRKNSNLYFMWIFYVWLDVFLLGWISMDSIRVTRCEIEHCVYAAMCVYCNWLPLHYLVTYGDMIICFFYFVPSGYLCWMQFMNYGRGETTNERFARNNRTASTGSELDTRTSSSFLLQNQDAEALLGGHKGKRPQKKGCWLNCKQMCCNKRIVSQEELLQMHMTSDAESRTENTSRSSAAT